MSLYLCSIKNIIYLNISNTIKKQLSVKNESLAQLFHRYRCSIAKIGQFYAYRRPIGTRAAF
jgi:hypothetical protein